MVADALIGRVVGGRYRVERKLGTGGLACVYEAEHLGLGKRVAIKLIDERFAESAEIVARFRREARLASVLEHDHIVQIFDVGEEPGIGLYMVMERLRGEDLGQKLAREGRLGLEAATAVAVQASWALAKAHASNVIHRDLKPENLFLVENPRSDVYVKLLDFGIAKLTRELAGSTALTAGGLTLGTPQYMSPEQIQAQRDIDPRTDIWSLGAVLFEALAGRPAYELRATYVDTVMQVCKQRPPSLRSVAPWVTPRLAAVVDDALEPDRDKRLPDATTFAERLLDALPAAQKAAVVRPSIVMFARRAEVLESSERPTDAPPPDDEVPASSRNSPDGTDDTVIEDIASIHALRTFMTAPFNPNRNPSGARSVSAMVMSAPPFATEPSPESDSLRPLPTAPPRASLPATFANQREISTTKPSALASASRRIAFATAFAATGAVALAAFSLGRVARPYVAANMAAAAASPTDDDALPTVKPAAAPTPSYAPPARYRVVTLASGDAGVAAHADAGHDDR